MIETSMISTTINVRKRGSKQITHARGCCDFIQKCETNEVGIILVNHGEEWMNKLILIIDMINNLFDEEVVTKRKKTLKFKEGYNHDYSNLSGIITHIINIDGKNKVIFKKDNEKIIMDTSILALTGMRRSAALCNNGNYNYDSLSESLRESITNPKVVSISNLIKISIKSEYPLINQFAYQLFRFMNKENDSIINILTDYGKKKSLNYDDWLTLIKSDKYLNTHTYWRVGPRIDEIECTLKQKDDFVEFMKSRGSLSSLFTMTKEMYSSKELIKIIQ